MKAQSLRGQIGPTDVEGELLPKEAKWLLNFAPASELMGVNDDFVGLLSHEAEWASAVNRERVARKSREREAQIQAMFAIQGVRVKFIGRKPSKPFDPNVRVKATKPGKSGKPTREKT